MHVSTSSLLHAVSHSMSHSVVSLSEFTLNKWLILMTHPYDSQLWITPMTHPLSSTPFRPPTRHRTNGMPGFKNNMISQYERSLHENEAIPRIFYGVKGNSYFFILFFHYSSLDIIFSQINQDKRLSNYLIHPSWTLLLVVRCPHLLT